MKVHIKNTLSESSTSDDVINLILKNRNIDATSIDPKSNSFFHPAHPINLSLSDFGFDQEYIRKAMSLVWSLHKPQRPIIVYSDYDADGITGGAILWETLHTLGFKAFPYIGNRIEEGYGFSKTGLDAVKKKYDPGLIISVDHGIAGDEMVKYAKETLDIDVIITDHHHRQEEKVPTLANAIFHIPTLSGSGTAYYVAKEIASHGGQLSKLFASDFVGLAAIGTIADLVPLIGPSRAIAKHGLEAISSTKRPGLIALKKASGNLGKTITTYEVGFMIAPRINASGRLADALEALRLLCTKNSEKAEKIAHTLEALNTERQEMVKSSVTEAIGIVEKMKEKNGDLPKILIVLQEKRAPTSWHEGIIGLIASKLVEKYHRPAVVFTKNNDGYKASARSISGFHLTDFLKNFSGVLSHFGGHAAAAGLSVSTENLEVFISEATKSANYLITEDMLEVTVGVDCELPLQLADINLAKKIETLAPFGMGNPKPKFISDGKISNIFLMGKEKNHTRFAFENGLSSLEMIAFGIAEEVESHNPQAKVIYTLDTNTWNGNTKVQAKVSNII